MNPTYTLKDLVIYFLKLGTWGFGGPVALVGYMHRDLVDDKKWISEEDYKEGLALSQLAPGPLAAQLAIYLGYVHHRVIGATLTGMAFVLPSFLMVIVIGFVYKAYEGLTWIQAIFYGVGACVIGIIAMTSYKLVTKSIGKDYWLWGIFILLAMTTFITESEILWLILAAGFLMWFIKAPPRFLTHTSVLAFPMLAESIATISLSTKLMQIAWFFTKAGAFVFGSGLAIVPFLYGGVVKEYHWLNEQQFLDAVAVAMITPGPVVITVGFIGYLVADVPGACVAALATFIPCYLFTIIPAPYFKKYGKSDSVKAFVDGVTAAAVGAIAGAVLVLGQRTLVDTPTVIIALTTMGTLLTFKKIPEPLLIAISALIGIILKTLL